MSERWVTATVLACSAVVLLVAAALLSALGAAWSTTALAGAWVGTLASALWLTLALPVRALVLGDARSRRVSVDGSGG